MPRGNSACKNSGQTAWTGSAGQLSVLGMHPFQRKRHRGSGARWIAARIGVGCLLGTAILTGTSVASQESALASCAAYHANVMSQDAANPDAFGNEGFIYVNTKSALLHLQDVIFRSLFIYPSAMTNVEFGWTDNNGGYTTPTPYSDYTVHGMTQPPTFYGNYARILNYNTSVRFRIENTGGRGIFRYVIAEQPSPIGYSPTMTFNGGSALTNSEHHNNCGTLWTDMYSLQEQTQISPEIWSATYFDLECWNNTSINGWYLHKFSDGEVQVNQTVGGWGNGCT